MQGMNGKDSLYGQAGNDLLIGGADADRFLIGDNNGADKIKDFQDGLDIIEFFGGNITANDVTVTNKSWGTLIDYGSGTVSVTGVSANLIDSNDFTFS